MCDFGEMSCGWDTRGIVTSIELLMAGKFGIVVFVFYLVTLVLFLGECIIVVIDARVVLFYPRMVLFLACLKIPWRPP